MWKAKDELEMTSGTLDGIMGLDQLEMEEKLESILQRNTPIVDSRNIGYIAAKRHLDPVLEARNGLTRKYYFFTYYDLQTGSDFP